MSHLPEQLVQLESAQLVRRLMEEEHAYIFKHALTQEQAYESVLLKRRREIHLRVARAYEQLDAGQEDEHAALLAFHYSEAGDQAKTLEYTVRAGDAAARVYANAEALAYYSRALELLRTKPSSEPEAELAATQTLKEVYLKRGRVLEVSGQYDRALQNYEEMRQAAQASGHGPFLLAALDALATVRSTPNPLFDRRQGLLLAQQALALARELGDGRAEARVLWDLLLVHGFSGHMAEAKKYGEPALALARKLDLREQLAYTLNDFANLVHFSEGRLTEGLALLEEAEAIWRRVGNRPMLANSLALAGAIRIMQGDFEQAEAESEEAYQIGVSIGNLWGQSFSRSATPLLYLERGELDRALAVAGECLALSERGGFAGARVLANMCFGLVLATAGAFDRARAAAETAAEQADEVLPFMQSVPLALLAYIQARLGQAEQAEACLARARAAARDGIPYSLITLILAEAELGMTRRDYAGVVSRMQELYTVLRRGEQRIFFPDALFFKGQALLELGRFDEAHAVLEEARSAAEALGSRRSLWRILLALGRIESSRGNQPEADSLRAQAQEIMTYILDHISEAELRVSFLKLPEVSGVLS